jgi:hypothetical protein
MVNERSIELHIEELALLGFAPADKKRIAAYIEHELTHLFSTQGVPQTLSQMGNTPFLNGGSFPMSQQNNPLTTGKQVAQTLYNGFSGPVNNKS